MSTSVGVESSRAHAAACYTACRLCDVMGHIRVTDATEVTSSKVWTIMPCDRPMESHVIVSRVASVQEKTHGRTERG